MKRKHFSAFILVLVCSFAYAQQPQNSCGVQALLTPGNDSIINSSAAITFQSISINATDYQFIINDYTFPLNSPATSQFLVGVTEVKLVAYNGACTDTATIKYFYPGTSPTDPRNLKIQYGSPNLHEFASDFIKSKDGGYILIGKRKDNSWQGFPDRNTIIKAKKDGCVEWAYVHDSTGDFQMSPSINKVVELLNGEILITGDDNRGHCFLAKLSSDGNLIWCKKIYDSQNHLLRIIGLKEMPDGDFITVSIYSGFILCISRHDTNGSIRWQKNYESEYNQYYGPRWSILLKEDYLYLSGASIMKLVYETGKFIWSKKYQLSGRPANSTELYSISKGILANIPVSIDNPGVYPSTTLMEIDTAGNVLTSKSLVQNWKHVITYSQIVPLPNKEFYMISSGYDPTAIQIPSNYKTLISKLDSSYNPIWSKYALHSMGLFYFAKADADQTMVLLGDQVGLGYSNHYYTVKTKITLKKIPPSGIESNALCSFSDYPLYAIPQQMTSSISLWSTIVTPINNLVSSSIYLKSYYPQVRYKCDDYIDSCAYLLLKGPATTCNFSDSYTYKVLKNKSCGQPTVWSVSSLVNIISQSDTTITVRFPGNGNYTVAAFLGLSCNPTKDSIIVRVAANTPIPDLGTDTAICPNNEITLHAGSKFLRYKWNDNSTDSIFKTSNAGLYWVEVTDSCGNTFRDSINISVTTSIPISIGPDRTKCNADTIQITAPAGFVSYEWSPNFNISSTSGQQIVVNPSTTTYYYLKAEKAPGCFAFDTVKISVLNSPPIALGSDKNICAGDSILLDAGTGFNQYLWNTGSVSQKITAKTVGSFSVTATTIDGCKSVDTVRILAILPIPIVALQKDSTLCIGEVRVLDAGAGYNSYIWNSGSRNQKISVNAIGDYVVRVIDAFGCKGYDSIQINKLLPSPVGFLGPDTSICAYGDILLRPTKVFNTYLWNTGNVSSAIKITQPGLYFLQVRDVNNCLGVDSVQVLLKECLQGFFMPTAFTPNNDGKNDFLKPILLGNVKQFKFTVYDRYGQLVFETSEVSKGWNGRIKGIEQNTGTFLWVCKFQLEGDSQNNKSGSVVLIR